MPNENANRIKSICSSLRKFLNEIYDTSVFLSFDEFCDRYRGIVGSNVDILVYIREKRWFKEKNFKNSDFLKFQYLSFELKSGSLKRFEKQDNLNKREEILNKSGYKVYESPLCLMLINNNKNILRNISEFSNLTKRLIVAFYKNCGSNSHHLESVSQRFVREFYRENPEINDNILKKFLKERLNLDTYIGYQRDEMYYQKNSKFCEFINSDTITHNNNELKSDKLFIDDLHTSLSKKNQTFGQVNEIYYVINTFKEDYFLYSENHLRSNYKTKQKFFAVYTKQGEKILNEEVFFANNLIFKAKQRLEDEAKDKILIVGNDNVIAAENQISEDPIRTINEFNEYSAKVIKRILDNLLNEAVIDTISVFNFNPERELLMPLICVRTDGENPDLTEIDISGSQNTIYSNCIVEDQEFDIWHPVKLRQEIRRSEDDFDDSKVKIYSDWLDDALSITSVSKNGERSCFICPLYRGGMQIGLIEFSSNEHSRVSPDIPLFRLVARLVGDALRRMELANDRGWLTRMSYVHAARHRIDRIHRQIHTIDVKLAEQLGSILRSSIDALSDREQFPKYVTIPEVIASIRERIDENFSEDILDQILKVIENSIDRPELPVHTAVSLIDIVDTISSNNQHTKVSASELSLSIHSMPNSADFLEVRYFSDRGKIRMPDARRICIAPIPDESTATTHYGLFLCAAQLRMVGGSAHMRTPKESLGNADYGVVFRVPIE